MYQAWIKTIDKLMKSKTEADKKIEKLGFEVCKITFDKIVYKCKMPIWSPTITIYTNKKTFTCNFDMDIEVTKAIIEKIEEL